MQVYKTHEVSKIIGIHVNTVRLYEKYRLISPPKRQSNGSQAPTCQSTLLSKNGDIRPERQYITVFQYYPFLHRYVHIAAYCRISGFLRFRW